MRTAGLWTDLSRPVVGGCLLVGLLVGVVGGKFMVGSLTRAERTGLMRWKSKSPLIYDKYITKKLICQPLQ